MKLHYHPPVLSPERIPPVQPVNPVSEAPLNFGYAVIGFVMPPAGLYIWLAYLLCQPKSSYRQAECALLGAGLGLLLAFAADLVLFCNFVQ